MISKAAIKAWSGRTESGIFRSRFTSESIRPNPLSEDPYSRTEDPENKQI